MERHRLPSTAAMVNALNGSMGLFNLLVMWVAVPLVAWAPADGGWAWVHEPFSWPSRQQCSYLMLNAVLALCFNVFLMLGVAFTSPVLTSVACILSIPAAALVDFLLYRTLLSPAAAAGCALICVGFVALAVSEHRAKRKAAAAGAVMATAALD
eukprot:Transcript_9477.p2 GENE.Transcript_9477~~Transcript_9477.p2  ORF type:complete len:154 (+),score=67.72 Transcript_9477:914-1375(+)